MYTNDLLRPVRIGLFLGLLSILFGMAWAVFLATQHERIHETFESQLEAFLQERFFLTDGVEVHHGDSPTTTHNHEGHSHNHGEKAAVDTHEAPSHEDPLIEMAHTRLTRGHLHAMGLGLLTIGVSLILALLNVPEPIKTVASVSIGLGSLSYPLSWIIMGYRTPVMGLEEAEKSVLLIVGPSVLLVLSGILIATFYLLKGIISDRFRSQA